MIDGRTGWNCRNCCSAAAASPAAYTRSRLGHHFAGAAVASLALLLHPLDLGGQLLLGGLHERVRRGAFEQRQGILDAAGARQPCARVTTSRASRSAARRARSSSAAAASVFRRSARSCCGSSASASSHARMTCSYSPASKCVCACSSARWSASARSRSRRRASCVSSIARLSESAASESGRMIARLIEESGGCGDRAAAQFVLPLRQPPLRLPFIKAGAGLLEHLRRALEIRIHQQRTLARRDHLLVVRRRERGGRFLQVQLDLSLAAFAELARRPCRVAGCGPGSCWSITTVVSSGAAVTCSSARALRCRCTR